MRWSRTLRFRLALWYALGGIVLLAGFTATLYVFVAERMARPLDQELRQDLETVERRLSVAADGKLLWDRRVLPDSAAWPAQNPWFEVWDNEGHLVKRMWPFTENRVQLMPAAPVRDRETISVFNVAQDLRLRVLSVPYAGHGVPEGWMIRVMRVHEPVGDALGALRLIILFALPVVVTLLVVGGYIVTRRWLAPLDEMVAEANRISAEEIDRRLPVLNPDDELGRLASVFNVTLDRLERSFSALNRFVADASHELRTPLTTLRSVGEIGLRRSRSVDEYRDIIGSMLEEAQRLELLVQRLLELARAEGGAAEPHCVDVTLDSFVGECVGEFAILAETKHQEISVEAPALVIVSDPVLLRQALQNLIDNAIKYSPAGGRIRVFVRTSSRTIRISVADEGPGIGVEHRANLAKRFYRPDRGRGRGTGGFGLGLSLTKAYVSILGGTLEFEAGEKSGSIFTLRLPNTSVSRAQAAPVTA
jgi:two-component system OmpR family sensor kinase